MRSKKDITYALLALIIGLIGLSYAAVPLYQLFCQKTGFGGTVQRYEWSDSNQTNLSTTPLDGSNSKGDTVMSKNTELSTPRLHTSNYTASPQDSVPSDTAPFKILFNADTTDSMPIIFKPVQKELYVYPGQPALAFYLAENKTDQVLTGVSTYNITPLKFGSYFIKIQCFCFEEQRFKPGEAVELPVLFVVSPDIQSELVANEPRLITLSYTFFKTN